MQGRRGGIVGSSTWHFGMGHASPGGAACSAVDQALLELSRELLSRADSETGFRTVPGPGNGIRLQDSQKQTGARKWTGKLAAGVGTTTPTIDPGGTPATARDSPATACDGLSAAASCHASSSSIRLLITSGQPGMRDARLKSSDRLRHSAAAKNPPDDFKTLAARIDTG